MNLGKPQALRLAVFVHVMDSGRHPKSKNIQKLKKSKMFLRRSSGCQGPLLNPPLPLDRGPLHRWWFSRLRTVTARWLRPAFDENVRCMDLLCRTGLIRGIYRTGIPVSSVEGWAESAGSFASHGFHSAAPICTHASKDYELIQAIFPEKDWTPPGVMCDGPLLSSSAVSSGSQS